MYSLSTVINFLNQHRSKQESGDLRYCRGQTAEGGPKRFRGGAWWQQWGAMYTGRVLWVSCHCGVVVTAMRQAAYPRCWAILPQVAFLPMALVERHSGSPSSPCRMGPFSPLPFFITIIFLFLFWLCRYVGSVGVMSDWSVNDLFTLGLYSTKRPCSFPV